MRSMTPTPPANLTMSEEEVAKLRHGLAHLAPSHVEAAYRKSLAGLVATDLPTPRMVQEFVTVWKMLWRYKWK
jgi:RES domain-containing protein